MSEKVKVSEKSKAMGLRIKQARLEQGGMEQKRLAELLNVTPRSVQDWEAGRVIPYKWLPKLEAILHRHWTWFLHGELGESPGPEMLSLLRENLQVSREILSLLQDHLVPSPT